MKCLGVLILPPDKILVHHRETPRHFVAGTHLYTWVERDNVELSFFSKEVTGRLRHQALNHQPLNNNYVMLHIRTTV